MNADPALEQPMEGGEGAPKTHISGCLCGKDLFEESMELPRNAQ